jgi:hypothetical protein
MENEIKKILFGAETERRLIVGSNNADYGAISCLVLQIEGSPPKGSALILISDSGIKSGATVILLKAYHKSKVLTITQCGYSAMWRTFTDYAEQWINQYANAAKIGAKYYKR